MAEVHVSQAPVQAHVVHFFVDDDDLSDALAAFLAGGLGTSHAVLVVCTPEHRLTFERSMASVGLDIDAARQERLLVFADASATLAAFTVDDLPDAARFERVVGDLLSQLAPDRPVRIFGEMVGLLWERGDVGAAIAVERLWEDLGRRTAFSLLCAYPAALGLHGDELSTVCGLHSSVVRMPPHPRDAARWEQFLCSVESPGAARRFVAAVLDEWDMADVREDAVLVISELATNAVMHARSHFTVGLTLDGEHLRISVGDTSDAAPHARRPDVSELGGRGLRMVDAIASTWGYDAVDGGKLVWAELPAAPEGRRRSA